MDRQQFIESATTSPKGRIAMSPRLLSSFLAICSATCLFAQMGSMRAPTFTKDVAPILQKHCQSCHRPGEAAPFSMLTYEEVRPRAGAMKLAVREKLMPPWYADPQVGHFSNGRSLSQSDIDTLVAWATAGSPKGDPKDIPAPLNFVEGWGIPKPDLTFQLPKEFSVPESGMVEYQYAIVPTGFTEDKWVQAVEVRPTERSVVHHIIAYIREPGSNYFKDQKPGVFFEAPPVNPVERGYERPA
jgi:hypothetical protein